MNEENQEFVNISNRLIVRGFLALILLAGVLWILPLYMQNKTSRLYNKSLELSVQVELLQREILLQELEINKLSSLEKLSEFAENAELGFNQIPTKVRVEGVRK